PPPLGNERLSPVAWRGGQGILRGGADRRRRPHLVVERAVRLDGPRLRVLQGHCVEQISESAERLGRAGRGEDASGVSRKPSKPSKLSASMVGIGRRDRWDRWAVYDLANWAWDCYSCACSGPAAC